MDEGTTPVFSPELCEHLMTALLQPDVTEHDISLSTDHAMKCEKCRPAVEDFIHHRVTTK
jgi:hypothetical protein